MADTNKMRTSIWIDRNLLNECDIRLNISGAKNRSEFIHKAIEYYCGYLAAENNFDYMSATIAELLNSIISLTEQRLSRLQFKQAVELAKLTKMIAPLCALEDSELERLHLDSLSEVKKINGILTYENVVKTYKKKE